MNVVVLEGTLSRAPKSRTLPSGSRLVSYEVTTRDAAGTCTVPVAWFDPPAAATALQAGDAVTVVGRVRRRFFQAGARTQSRTEVVASEIVATRRAARARRAVARAAGLLAGVSGTVPPG